MKVGLGSSSMADDELTVPPLSMLPLLVAPSLSFLPSLGEGSSVKEYTKHIRVYFFIFFFFFCLDVNLDSFSSRLVSSRLGEEEGRKVSKEDREGEGEKVGKLAFSNRR